MGHAHRISAFARSIFVGATPTPVGTETRESYSLDNFRRKIGSEIIGLKSSTARAEQRGVADFPRQYNYMNGLLLQRQAPRQELFSVKKSRMAFLVTRLWLMVSGYGGSWNPEGGTAQG